MNALPTFDDIVETSRRIQGHAHRTPVMTSRTADALLGASVHFKCENLQRMGAFKFRGAFNALSRFTPAQRKAGVVAFSSGNHAQAIALSARLLGIPAGLVFSAVFYISLLFTFNDSFGNAAPDGDPPPAAAS